MELLGTPALFLQDAFQYLVENVRKAEESGETEQAQTVVAT